jgi:hypothetical protein
MVISGGTLDPPDAALCRLSGRRPDGHSGRANSMAESQKKEDPQCDEPFSEPSYSPWSF